MRGSPPCPSTLFILGLATAHSAQAAEAPRYNQIRFQVESSRPVDNDRMQAVLSTTAEDDKRRASRRHREPHHGLGIEDGQGPAAHRGAQRRLPHLPGVRQRQDPALARHQKLLLEGPDFAALGALIGQLQERLQVTAINFSVSPVRRAAAEDELIAQALDAFKQRAELVRKQFGAKGYRVVDVSINTADSAPIPMLRAQGKRGQGKRGRKRGRSELNLSSPSPRRRSAASPFPHAPAERRFNLFTKALVAEREVAGQAFTDVMELRLRELVSKQLTVGMLARSRVAIKPEIEVMVLDQGIGATPGVPGVRRPAVLVGTLHHAGRHRVQLDVAVAGQQVIVGRDEARLVPPLEQGTAAAVAPVHVQHIQSADMLHEPRDRALLLGRHEQVDMLVMST